jgi:DNA-nicking Smr family endonuclease
LIPKNTYLYITGDATGQNATAMTKGNLTAFDIIKDELNLSIDNFNLPKKNIAHQNSHTIVNKALKMANVTFNPEMKYTILDLKFLEFENNQIKKKEAEKLGRGHLADCIRYDLHINFYDL